MAQLTVNHILAGGIADPTGSTGVSSGFQFSNDGVGTCLRIVNSPTVHNAVATISLGAATPSGGTYALSINIFGVIYTTAAIAYNAIASAVATAVLAATATLTGNAMSADFSAATCVGGGTNLPTGPMTLTFGGAGLAGLAQTPITVTLDDTLVTGGSYSVATTTAGVGNGRMYVNNPNTNVNTVVSIPTGTSWYGPFNMGLYNIPTGQTNAGEVSVTFDAQFANYTVTCMHIG